MMRSAMVAATLLSVLATGAQAEEWCASSDEVTAKYPPGEWFSRDTIRVMDGWVQIGMKYLLIGLDGSYVEIVTSEGDWCVTKIHGNPFEKKAAL